MITVSIVSHNHGKMVEKLVQQVLKCENINKIIITLNIPEKINIPDDSKVLVLSNNRPKGFGTNHNVAFTHSISPWFVVLNPDVIILEDPFSKLVKIALLSNANIISPQALTSSGVIEDNWRRFPTLYSLFLKFFNLYDGRYKTPKCTDNFFQVEWVSGLFMLFNQESYRLLQGFDERYFMYYEDIDICARSWVHGFKVMACPTVKIIHNAQRASRYNLRHMFWHIRSILRFISTKYNFPN